MPFEDTTQYSRESVPSSISINDCSVCRVSATCGPLRAQHRWLSGTGPALPDLVGRAAGTKVRAVDGGVVPSQFPPNHDCTCPLPTAYGCEPDPAHVPGFVNLASCVAPISMVCPQVHLKRQGEPQFRGTTLILGEQPSALLDALHGDCSVLRLGVTPLSRCQASEDLDVVTSSFGFTDHRVPDLVGDYVGKCRSGALTQGAASAGGCSALSRAG